MKIPWTANSVLRRGAPLAVGTTIGDLELLDLDVRPLAVLHGGVEPTDDGVGRRVDGARATAVRRSPCRRRSRSPGTGCPTTVPRGRCRRARVVVVGDADLGIALQLTRVVGAVRRVGVAAGRVPALQRTSVDVRR